MTSIPLSHGLLYLIANLKTIMEIDKHVLLNATFKESSPSENKLIPGEDAFNVSSDLPVKSIIARRWQILYHSTPQGNFDRPGRVLLLSEVFGTLTLVGYHYILQWTLVLSNQITCVIALYFAHICRTKEHSQLFFLYQYNLHRYLALRNSLTLLMFLHIAQIFNLTECFHISNKCIGLCSNEICSHWSVLCFALIFNTPTGCKFTETKPSYYYTFKVYMEI